MQDKAKTVSVYQKKFIIVQFCQQQLSVITKPICLGLYISFVPTPKVTFLQENCVETDVLFFIMMMMLKIDPTLTCQ